MSLVLRGVNELNMRPVGQGVKTPPFHGGNRGSNPLRVTFIPAVVVERQTRYLEGVVSNGRVGSNPTDRTIHKPAKVLVIKDFFVMFPAVFRSVVANGMWICYGTLSLAKTNQNHPIIHCRSVSLEKMAV